MAHNATGPVAVPRDQAGEECRSKCSVQTSHSQSLGQRREQAIRADLIGSTTCAAGGITATRRTPMLHALYYGTSRAPLARVVPAAGYPGMWRIACADGSLSGMVNLDRAKDAAAAIAERGPPARNRRRLHWKQERSKTGLAAPPMRYSGPPTTEGWIDWPAATDGDVA